MNIILKMKTVSKKRKKIKMSKIKNNKIKIIKILALMKETVRINKNEKDKKMQLNFKRIWKTQE